jgi:hypothetical protein
MSKPKKKTDSVAVFTPTTPFERAVYEGDLGAMLGLLDAMRGPERVALGGAVRRMHALVRTAGWDRPRDKERWGVPVTETTRRAIAIATLICGTTADLVESFISTEDAVTYGLRFRPSSLEGYGGSEIDIGLAHALVRAGLIPRPTGDEYVRAVISLPLTVLASDDILAWIDEEDPGLLGAHDGAPVFLLRFFEVEGTSETSLATADKYTRTRGGWRGVFLRLIERGTLTRATVIERILHAIEHDWPQFRTAWFIGLHADLAPTADEMRPFADRYLALHQSRIAPTLGLAIEATAKLFDASMVDGAAVLGAIGPSLTSKVKGHVLMGLDLLERVAKREPSLVNEVSAVALEAFATSAPDVHKRLVARLGSWGMSETTKARARTLLPHVAASSRDALAAMLGRDVSGARQPARATSPEVTAAAGAFTKVSAIDSARVREPVADIHELTSLIAHVFENEHDVGAFERSVEAIVRMAPFGPAARDALSPVLVRPPRSTLAVATSLYVLLCAIVRDEPSKTSPPSKTELIAHERLRALIDFARRGTGLSPLASPTHRFGYIAPDALIERVRAYEAAGATAPLVEQSLAILRLAPGVADASTRQAARTLVDTPFARAFRHAVGDDVELGEPSALFVAASRIRHSGADDPRAIALYGDEVPDGAGVARHTWRTVSWAMAPYRWYRIDVSLTGRRKRVPRDWLAARRYAGGTARRSDEQLALSTRAEIHHASQCFPSNLEPIFAVAVEELTMNMDWSEARWANKAFLEVLLDETVTMTPLAQLVLALGLACKEPGEVAVSVDALVAAHTQARLDAPSFAETMSALLPTHVVKVARWHKSLETASRSHPSAPALVFELLCRVLANAPSPAPKDTSALVELALELAAEHHLTVNETARGPLALLELPARGKTARKALLALG